MTTAEKQELSDAWNAVDALEEMDAPAAGPAVLLASADAEAFVDKVWNAWPDEAEPFLAVRVPAIVLERTAALAGAMARAGIDREVLMDGEACGCFMSCLEQAPAGWKKDAAMECAAGQPGLPAFGVAAVPEEGGWDTMPEVLDLPCRIGISADGVRFEAAEAHPDARVLALVGVPARSVAGIFDACGIRGLACADAEEGGGCPRP